MAVHTSQRQSLTFTAGKLGCGLASVAVAIENQSGLASFPSLAREHPVPVAGPERPSPDAPRRQEAKRTDQNYLAGTAGPIDRLMQRTRLT